MDKEDVIHTYNRILLNHQKEQHRVICSDVARPRGFLVGSVVKNSPGSAGDARDRDSVSELSLSPRVCTNSCPSSQWCYPTISSSVVPFSSHLQSSQHQGLFQEVSSSNQVAKVLEFRLQHQSFQWISRTYFLEDWLVGSPCSPRGSQESSPTPHFKSISSSVLSFLHSPTLTSIHDHWKNP